MDGLSRERRNATTMKRKLFMINQQDIIFILPITNLSTDKRGVSTVSIPPSCY